MPTNHDWHDALIEGRWRPEIETGVSGEAEKPHFYARYRQGDEVLETKSPYSPMQAEDDLMSQLRQGTLDGKYYPTN